MNVPNQDYTLALISNITHQAINPLNGVIGTLDNLIDGTIDDNRRGQRLKSARAQLEYTVSLIRNLAYFAQYGTDATPEPKFRTSKTCIIRQLLIEAAQFFQEQGVANQIWIEVVGTDIQNAVPGDPELLRQVFMNLFDNFVKYGIPGSTVTVKQWIKQDSNDLIITISGKSIPFDKTEDIFALGIRGKKAIDKTSSGSGLGLHVCKLIIDRLFKGSIQAQFVHKTQLANFEIRLPNASTRIR